MLTLDLINTVAFGGVVLFVGYGVRRLIPVLSRYNVPAPVIGGLLVAAAMVGIVSGGLIGGPVGTILIERHRLRRRKDDVHHDPPIATQIVEDRLPEPESSAPPGEDKESYALLKALVVLLVAMWLGSGVSAWFQSIGLTLPAYIGAMIVAAIIRNADGAAGLLGL